MATERTERREIVVRLDLDPAQLSERELRAGFAAAVDAALAREAGWRPVGASDLDSLLDAGRITQGKSRYSVTEQYYLLHAGPRRRPIGRLESVTLELELERAER